MTAAVDIRGPVMPRVVLCELTFKVRGLCESWTASGRATRGNVPLQTGIIVGDASSLDLYEASVCIVYSANTKGNHETR